MKNEIKMLKKFAEKARVNLTLLALHLGYSSHDPVKKWIERDSIPSHQLKRVEGFINEQVKKRN